MAIWRALYMVHGKRHLSGYQLYVSHHMRSELMKKRYPDHRERLAAVAKSWRELDEDSSDKVGFRANAKALKEGREPKY